MGFWGKMKKQYEEPKICDRSVIQFNKKLINQIFIKLNNINSEICEKTTNSE